MKRVRIEDTDNRIQPSAVMHSLTDPLGLTDMALNYYELEAGDSLAFAYHAHEIQEEVFCVLDGTITFETEGGPVTVAEGEVVRFGPGEFQRGWNHEDDRAVVLAMGAPLEYGEQDTLRECPDCERRTQHDLERAGDEEAVVAVCTECGTETGRWVRGSMDGTVP